MSKLTGEVAPPGTTCPGCGIYVGGYFVGIMPDGRPTWDRPSVHHLSPTGVQFTAGGLTHVFGGERCIP